MVVIIIAIVITNIINIVIIIVIIIISIIIVVIVVALSVHMWMKSWVALGAARHQSRNLPMVARARAARRGSEFAHFNAISAEIGRNDYALMADSAQHGPISTQVGRVQSKFDRIRPKSGRCSIEGAPNLIKLDPTSARAWRMSACPPRICMALVLEQHLMLD